MQSTNARAVSRWKANRIRWKVLLFCLLAALIVAVFAFSTPAQAQDDSYVDLSIEIVPGVSWKFFARNHGTADAYGVTVDIELADQTVHSSGDGFTQNSGTTCSGDIPGTSCVSGVWTVGFLGAGEEKEFGIGPRLASGLSCCSGLSTNWSVPARAVIKNTVPAEEDRFNGNNTDVDWIFVNQGGTDTEAAVGRYWLEARVDDLLPEAGDTVKFTIEANSDSHTRPFTGDAKVRLTLDNGMGTPTASPPGSTTFAAVTGLTRTWDWDIGNINVAALEVSTTLDNPLPAGVSRSDLCLTAELTSRPANTIQRPTTAEICLREDPVVLFEEGELDLFYLHPCAGVTPIEYPCRDENSDSTVDNGLELVVSAAIDDHPVIRRSGVFRVDGGSGSSRYVFLRPEGVVVRVDPEARVGTKWYTGSDEDSDSNDAGIIPGVLAHLEFLGEDGKPYTFAIADVDPKNRPGSLALPRMDNTGFTILDADEQTSLGPISADLVEIPLVVVFGTLGTNVVDITMGGTYSGTAYAPKGRYTFHVGPVAELEVSDGGAGRVPSGTRAFTIVAINNGRDDAPDAQVTLTGLSTSDYVSHTATKGDFNSSTGVWTIGELITKDVSQGTRGRDGEVLTIITSAASGAGITAAITNTQEYQVCIDSDGDDVVAASESACTGTTGNTWHTAKYYDYISDNDSASIEARDGTGADLPSVRNAQADTASIIVSWDAQSEVNGRSVTHYEIEWSADGSTGWTQLSDNVSETMYADTGVSAGQTRHYRVRAVNDRDQKGPWSASITGTVAAPVTPEPEVRTQTVFRDRVVTQTETVVVSAAPQPFARFSPTQVARSIAENSAPGSAVGAPVSVMRSSGNSVAYSLEGTDAALFTIESDTGQILVGQDTVLDYESGTTSYTVVVVADPSSGDDVRATVTITVTDVAETATVVITPAGQPETGVELTATLTHGGGTPTNPAWQWQRSANGGLWVNIEGAMASTYTPTDEDAGHRLRVIVIYGEPGGGYGVAGAVTETMADDANGTATTLSAVVAAYDANGDGRIDLTEVLTAIGAYFAEDLDLGGVLEVIGAYFAG